MFGNLISWIIAGIALAVIVYALQKMPGYNLSKKFMGMGIVKGRSYNEIISYVGNPNAISTLPNGKQCQWIRQGCFIALIFDENDICEGVAQQITV